MVKVSLTDLDKPLGLQKVEASRISGESALEGGTCRLYAQEIKAESIPGP
jgi:hypothetical protein